MKRLKNQLLLIFFLAGTTLSFAQNDLKRTQHFNLENGLAIGGYDPVSYFAKGKPEKGNANYQVTYRGVSYHFSSKENKEKFLKSPSHYEPQYGGWCAYAMGEEAEKVKVDPETFKVVNGKLYLFYNFYLTNTLKSWNKDEATLKSKADKNWESILSK